jgi:hypothetical protein
LYRPLNFEIPPCEHHGVCCQRKFGNGPKQRSSISSEDKQPVLEDLWLNKKEILRIWLENNFIQTRGNICINVIFKRFTKAVLQCKSKVAVQKQKLLQILNVFVTSVIQRATGMHHTILPSAACLALPICTLSKKWYSFQKNLLNLKFVSRFSPQNLSETFSHFKENSATYY